MWRDASGPTDLRKDLTETGNHAWKVSGTQGDTKFNLSWVIFCSLEIKILIGWGWILCEELFPTKHLQVPDRQSQETKKCFAIRYSTKRSRPPSSLIFLLLISWGSNYQSFWNLPSIVSSCTRLKIWIWSLCVSIFVWYNRMPTELQSVCSTETWAGLIGHQFWPWRRLVLIIIIITNFVSSWSWEPVKKLAQLDFLWPLILQGYTVYCSNVYLLCMLLVS